MKNDGKPVLAYSPVGSEPLGPRRRFVCDHRDEELRVEVKNYGTRSRRLSVVVLESAYEPNPDLLERASVELAEAYIKAKQEQVAAHSFSPYAVPSKPELSDYCQHCAQPRESHR